MTPSQPNRISEFLSDAITHSGLSDEPHVSEVRRLGGGESAQVWQFSARLDGISQIRFVARWYVPGQASSAFGDLSREHAAMTAASDEGAKAPRIVGLVTGRLDGVDIPVLITEHVEGAVPSAWIGQDRETIIQLRDNAAFKRSSERALAQMT